jgi:hypothetical protein
VAISEISSLCRIESVRPASPVSLRLVRFCAARAYPESSISATSRSVRFVLSGDTILSKLNAAVKGRSRVGSW